MKQLLIILYKINVYGISNEGVAKRIINLRENVSLSNDEELKNYYIIREIFLPIFEGESDAKIIYPNLMLEEHQSTEKNIINNLTKKIKETNNKYLIEDWKQILRTLKLRILKNKLINE